MIEVRYTNDKLLGHAILDVDGFYYFECNQDRGFWSEHGLRYIADKLEELNGSYNKLLRDYE